MGCVVFEGAIPGRHRGRPHRPGLSGRGVQHPRRRRRLHGRLPARLAARASRSPTAAPTPTPAAPWSSRATAARRRCRAGPSCSTSSPTARRSGRCATTPSSSTCTGPPPGCADWPELAVFAFDHRTQLEELAGGGADAAGAHRPLQGPARRGRAPRRGERAPRRQRRGASARSSTTATARRRCRRSPASALDRPAGRAARARGRWPSRPAPSWRWRCAPGRPSTSPSAWSATTRTIRRSCARRSSTRLQALQRACIGTDRELLVEVIPPREIAGSRRHRWRARWRRSTPPASGPTGGSCRRRDERARMAR